MSRAAMCSSKSDPLARAEYAGPLLRSTTVSTARIRAPSIDETPAKPRLGVDVDDLSPAGDRDQVFGIVHRAARLAELRASGVAIELSAVCGAGRVRDRDRRRIAGGHVARVRGHDRAPVIWTGVEL